MGKLDDTIAKIGGITTVPEIHPDTIDPAFWAEYAEILRRVEAPQEGDADRLVELAKKLELTSEEVKLHLMVLAEHEKMIDEKIRLPERKAELDANIKAREKNREVYFKTREKCAKTEEQLEILNRTLLRKWVDCNQIEFEIQSLEFSFPGIFGLKINEEYDINRRLPIEILNLMNQIERKKEEAEQCRQKKPPRR
jgi:hypothetical protein